MKETIKTIFAATVITLMCLVVTVQGIFWMVGPNYEEGSYVMTYKVYYSQDNAKTYTIKNNYPISVHSSRGTNYVTKIRKVPFIINGYNSQTVFESSAPIEVVSYGRE